MSRGMRTQIVVLYVVFFILIIITLIGLLDGRVTSAGLTSASVIGQTKCVGSNAAETFIDKMGCERIYEDPECAARGLVEIRC